MNLSDEVYKILKTIPSGKVTTYKEIATSLNVKCYRHIGQILAKNPYAPIVPCHRVVKSNGEIGGFNGSKENREKVELLKNEGIEIENGKIKNFEKVFFRF